VAVPSRGEGDAGRESIASFGSVIAGWPVAAAAQQPVRPKRIGILVYWKSEHANLTPMLRELEASGHIDGKTIVIGYRDADGKVRAAFGVTVPPTVIARADPN
jgi:hypothetical protein